MFERCLYFNINTLARKLNSHWEKAFSELDLSPAHAYLLRLVLETPGKTQQDLAEELHLNKSTIARFISALEKKGLLIRKETGKDHRERIILPSYKAIRLHKKLEKTGDDLYLSMINILGKKKFDLLVKQTRSLNEKL